MELLRTPDVPNRRVRLSLRIVKDADHDAARLASRIPGHVVPPYISTYDYRSRCLVIPHASFRTPKEAAMPNPPLLVPRPGNRMRPVLLFAAGAFGTFRIIFPTIVHLAGTGWGGTIGVTILII